MTWHLDDYRCTLLHGILRHSFQETSPRNTAENTAKHRGGGVGSVVANHRGGGESSVTVTTLALTFVLHSHTLMMHYQLSICHNGTWRALQQQTCSLLANAKRCHILSTAAHSPSWRAGGGCSSS